MKVKCGSWHLQNKSVITRLIFLYALISFLNLMWQFFTSSQHTQPHLWSWLVIILNVSTLVLNLSRSSLTLCSSGLNHSDSWAKLGINYPLNFRLSKTSIAELLHWNTVFFWVHFQWNPRWQRQGVMNTDT